MKDSKRASDLLTINEQTLQLLEFVIADGRFGINVAKVSAIMRYGQHQITPMPNSNPFVEGIFKPRDETMTVINLASYMGLPPSNDEEKDILIITKINNTKTAFHVHAVDAIATVSLADVEKPDATIYGGEESMATAVATYKDRLITIVDFEKILLDISPSQHYDPANISVIKNTTITQRPILVVEDSPLLEQIMLKALEKAGFVNIICASNGQEAWNLLKQFKERGGAIEDHVAALITDIEMPLMDGHALAKLMKEDNVLCKIPIFAFSSIVTDVLRDTGRDLGIIESVSKPQIASLIQLIDQHIL